MAGWVDDLLEEWSARFAALPPPNDAPAEPSDAPTHALDLLRVHVARSGVELKLSAPTAEPQGIERRARRPTDAGMLAPAGNVYSTPSVNEAAVNPFPASPLATSAFDVTFFAGWPLAADRSNTT